MSSSILIFLFLANFIFIFLKAFQQRNVAHMHYLPVIPTSILMAIAEVYTIGVIASMAVTSSWDWLAVGAIAFGGGVGCIASMWCHKIIFKGEEE